MPVSNLGRIGFVTKGGWSAGEYKYLDVVKHVAATWICAVPTTDEEPGTGADWQNALTAPSVTGITEWSQLSGTQSPPLIVYDDQKYWTLITTVSDIAANKPSESPDVFRSNGLIDDAVTSELTTWSSEKINSLSVLNAPLITSPSDGAIDCLGEITSTYTTSPSYAGTQDWVRWESSTLEDFSVLVDSYEGSSNLTSWTPAIDMTLTQIFIRTKQGSDGHRSEWSTVVSFTTPNTFVKTPTLAVIGAPDYVPEAPTLTTSAFAVIGGSDTHLNTDWQILDDQLQVVWESLEDAVNKLSIVVPVNTLLESATYTFRARHRGTSYGESAWVNIVATTVEEFYDDGSSIDGLTFAAMKAAGNYDPVTDTGFFGEVPAGTLFTGPQIASAIGLTEGTAQHDNEPWLKFYVGATANCNRNNGIPYVLYIAKKPYRHSTSWDAIDARGAVYWGAGATVQKAGETLDVGLMFGAYADPANSENAAPLSTDESCEANHGGGSHWNDLIYRVMSETPSCPSSDTYHGGRQVGVNWASYQNSDLIIASGNGRRTWCQETSALVGTTRVGRGTSRLSYLVWYTSSGSTSSAGFRPALRLS